jgi:hypothetical protein
MMHKIKKQNKILCRKTKISVKNSRKRMKSKLIDEIQKETMQK